MCSKASSSSSSFFTSMERDAVTHHPLLCSVVSKMYLRRCASDKMRRARMEIDGLLGSSASFVFISFLYSSHFLRPSEEMASRVMPPDLLCCVFSSKAVRRSTLCCERNWKRICAKCRCQSEIKVSGSHPHTVTSQLVGRPISRPRFTVSPCATSAIWSVFLSPGN